MRFRHAIILLLSFAPTWARAYELVVIQAVSETKRTFIIRNGLRQGFTPGMTATFTADDVSILARARMVTGQYTQWEVVNPDAVLPFPKGAVVTHYPATEYLWALTPEAERKKWIKSQIPDPKRSWVFKGALTRGLSESVSDAPAVNPQRGGFLGEAYYESDIAAGFAWDVGYRYEREIANYEGASFSTTRSVALVDLIHYFEQFRDLIGGRLYLGLGLGYGLSNTKAVGLTQSGPVAILPVVKLGVSMPFNETWEFVTDGAFESLQTREKQEDGRIQTTTQTNFKAGVGLRRFF